MEAGTIAGIGAFVAFVIFIDVLAVEVRRIFREGMRIVRRLEAYADHPLIGAVATAEADAERFLMSLSRLATLLTRLQAVLVRLRVLHPPIAGGLDPQGQTL